MRIRKRLQAPLYGNFEFLGGIRFGETHGCLYQGQQVLRAMVDFASKQSDVPLLALALGDVADNLHGPDDSAISISDGRKRQRYLDQASVLASANGFVVIDTLAALDTLQDERLLVLAFGRNQNRDRLADDLVGGIPEKPLSSPVPSGDNSVKILACDGVLGRLDDR
jgi:hypothetical protein